MATAEDDAVSAMARVLVQDAAPEELPLFGAMRRAYLDHPGGGVESKRGREDMLGFGADAAVMLVTPVAFEVARRVVTYLVAQLKSSVEAETSDAIAERVHRLLHCSKGDADGGPRLTHEQLEEVHRIAVEHARALNLSETQADMLGDAVVGSLAIE